MRKCGKCSTGKPDDDFYKKGTNRTSWCKQCCREYARNFKATVGFQREKEQRKEYVKAGLRYDGKPRRMRNPQTELHRRARSSYWICFRRSMHKGEPFDLTLQWVRDSFDEFARKSYCDLSKGSPFRPSLDRIDPNGRYSQENVKVCWLIENLAKNSFSEEDVVNFCKMKLGILTRPE